MNQVSTMKPSREKDNLRASSLHQMTAREALLAAALERSFTAASFGGNLRLLGNNFNGYALSGTPLLNAAGGADAHLRDLLMSQGFGRPQAHMIRGLPNPAHSLPSALLESERRRMEHEQLQAIRQQVLAITEDNPFSGVRAFLPTIHETPSLQLNGEGTLHALGSAMRKKDSPYIDASSMSDPHPRDIARRRTRGGVTEPFPEKLHRMLTEVEEAGDGDIISFFSHGRAFGVHDPERFVSKVMPKYFKQSRLSSFQRQLNLYGFTRISSGPDAGGYYHELFLKGRSALSTHMRRVGVPQGEDRRKMKTGASKAEPDFYAMGTVVRTRN